MGIKKINVIRKQYRKINTLFIILFLTLNYISLISCSNMIKSHISINRNIIEIKSDPEFFNEVKTCMKSLDEGVFIHYDYSDDDEEEKKETNEVEEEEELSDEKKREVLNQEMEELKRIEENIEKFKNGEINEEELRQSNSKLDKMIRKYSKKNENELEKKVQVGPAKYDEDSDEEDQNSMIKSYISEKLEDAEDLESTAFDDEVIVTIKKLNILKLFTMETKVHVQLAATF